MSLGGGSSNDKIVKMEKQAAAEARAKEAERQARIKAGLEKINAQFEGGPIYTTQEVSWNPGTALPQGYSLPTGYRISKGRLFDANGREVRNPLKLTRQVEAGVQPGFDDNFYNNYRSAYEGYYMPELADQYTNAKKKLTFGLADAGTTRSSMAGDLLADLVEQNEVAKGKIRQSADAAVGGLKDNVLAQKSALIGQLYSTENPDIAANSATNAVRTLRENPPTYSPLGDAFTLAMVGGAGYLGGQNARNQYYGAYGQYPKYGGNAGSNII